MSGIRGFTGWIGTVLGSPDPEGLARFWASLLGGEVKVADETWVTLRTDDSRHYLAFQREDGHVPPVWPAGPGDQQMQVHLDVGVRDLDAAVADALARGAVEAAYQPQQDVRVMLDPAGHPFCLYVDSAPD